jgi:outer membrane biosynthesis protein TonB
MQECTNAGVTRYGARVGAVLHVCIVAVLASLASGCATVNAKPAADQPALEVPAPPPRSVETSDTEPPPPATLPDEPARHASPPASRRPPAPSPAPKPETREPAKPEVPPPPSPEPAKPAPEPAKAPTTLQTASADAEGKEGQQIRAQLAKASDDLKHIDYRRLSADARTQYDTAKQFVAQAESALRAKNLVLARSVADKAAALAAQLAGK